MSEKIPKPDIELGPSSPEKNAEVQQIAVHIGEVALSETGAEDAEQEHPFHLPESLDPVHIIVQTGPDIGKFEPGLVELGAQAVKDEQARRHYMEQRGFTRWYSSNGEWDRYAARIIKRELSRRVAEQLDGLSPDQIAEAMKAVLDYIDIAKRELDVKVHDGKLEGDWQKENWAYWKKYNKDRHDAHKVSTEAVLGKYFGIDGGDVSVAA